MADDKAEKDVRDVLDNSEFEYNLVRYKIIKNAKPFPETKTDFYILAENLKDGTNKEFKISYKKPTFSFIENKIRAERIKIIYGDNWSKILQDQIFQKNTRKENEYWKKKKPEESLEDSLKNFPLIDFEKKKILLGWRYEIEQLDSSGTGKRLHSGKIGQDITPQIFWGEDCSDYMRDALVEGVRVPGSGVPEFILIRNPDEIKTADDVFKNIQDIKDYARHHKKMRAAFIAQYYRWSKVDARWKTESSSRVFAVYVEWKVVDGKLRGRPVLDHPLEIQASEVLDTLKNCLREMEVEYEPNLNLEKLHERLSDDTVSKG